MTDRRRYPPDPPSRTDRRRYPPEPPGRTRRPAAAVANQRRYPPDPPSRTRPDKLTLEKSGGSQSQNARFPQDQLRRRRQPPPPRRPPPPPATHRRPVRAVRRPVRRIRLGNPRHRLSVAFLAVCMLFSLIGGRLVQLQGLDASMYARDAESERITSRLIPGGRGEIFDANGVALASTVEAYDVVADQLLVAKATDVALIVRKLHRMLGMDVTTLRQRLTGDKRYAYVARDVTPVQARAVRTADIPGVTTEQRTKRTYPSNAVAGNVIGFAGRDGEGLAGIEQGLDYALAGAPGKVTYWRAPNGAAVPLTKHEEKAPVQGSHVHLTLDRELQWHAERTLTAKVAEAQAQSGSIVVMRKTGEILALASTPAVDPNHPGKTPKNLRGNRAVEEMYEPGSVAKVLTAAALIDSKTVTPETVLTVPGSLRRSGKTITDHSSHGTMQLTFAGVIAQSSNIGTILAAERMPKADLRNYLVKFGIGQKADLGLPGETPGSLPEEWPDLTRDTIAFGQSVSTNIVQMASAYATIANDGVRVPPRLVSHIVAPNGTRTVPDTGPPERVISPESARTVAYLMEGVMGPGGTGSKIKVPGYRLAGKTGTAQRVDPSCGCYRGYTASFMGFAPADNPEIVVAVSIQDPQAGRYGGTLGGPVFADVMSFALQRLAIPPTGAEPPRVKLEP
jgi:cell division protein FtsI (penicillin-binding protein 3)